MADYRKKSNGLQSNGTNDSTIPNGNIDINELANLIANKVAQTKGLSSNSCIINRDSSAENEEFDDTNSMDQLAQSMVVQRGNKSSNFDGLGGVKETKKDKKQTDNTIDLLSDLED